MLTFKQALSRILASTNSYGIENISIYQAFGRTLAEDVFADRDYPPFFRASMDGYAIRKEDFDENITTFEVMQHIHAGDICTLEIQKGQCFKIMTGAAVPLSANAIIRVEDSQILPNNEVKLFCENIKTYQNISKKGEDKKKDDLIICKGTPINQVIWAALAVVGKCDLKVNALPKICIISTGNEIKQVHEAVSEVQIRDSNSFTMRATLAKFNIIPTKVYHVNDNEIELKNVLLSGLENDIMLISGGVSAGDADFVPTILQSLGIKKIFHKVQIKPGKPLWFGVTETGKTVFALPGNPLSVQVACKIFIEPFLKTCFQNKDILPQRMIFMGNRVKNGSLDEFLPAKINPFNGKLEIKKINGSGDISASLHSDGVFLHPASTSFLQTNDVVDFYAWN